MFLAATRYREPHTLHDGPGAGAAQCRFTAAATSRGDVRRADPIRKSDAWWSMAQDERRAIFEERSGHIAKSMPYLPAIARRLHHARDLGEPFDFLTWFEYAPEHADAFEA